MAKSAMINARVEPKLKHEVEGILSRIGLNTTQAVTLFFRHVKNYRGLPFDVRIPNKTTRKAIAEARNGKGKKFKSTASLLEELGK
ncbi:MAG: type II toxin-antitoxin system RelB/DinJ family antitoxin [Bacteroidota bacterium]